MAISGKTLEILGTGSPEDCFPILNEFNIQNEQSKSFPNVDKKTKEKLWAAIFTRLQNPATTPELIRLFLSSLRILSREKSTLEMVMDDERVDTILQIAGLKESPNYENCSHTEALEGLKVLFNMIFQSPILQTMFISNELLETLMNKIKLYKTNALPPEIKYFTMRILFMITALCQETAPKVRYDLKGLVYITEFLGKMIEVPEKYDNMTTDIICETLKVLYNIIHDIVPNKNDVRAQIADEEDLKHLLKITKLVRAFLLHETEDSKKKDELDNHAIDLLAAVSWECFPELIFKTNETEFYYDGSGMAAVEAIVHFLNNRLERIESGRTLTDSLSPVMCVLVRMCGSSRVMRKYLKERVLPPLKKTDVTERPEVGSSIRNKLCSLLTSPAGYVTELVATFLFILCKESVKRLIKYTGYGNAAGLLANRGLLLGGKGNDGEYSSDSENSDTDEYREVRHLINDVEGWIQPERPHPCEGMTDEQKEFEAMKLVQAIDKLSRSNTIQPCRIGPDGRPQPVEHVLQLQEAVDIPLRTMSGRTDSDSDSD